MTRETNVLTWNDNSDGIITQIGSSSEYRPWIVLSINENGIGNIWFQATVQNVKAIRINCESFLGESKTIFVFQTKVSSGDRK